MALALGSLFYLITVPFRAIFLALRGLLMFGQIVMGLAGLAFVAAIVWIVMSGILNDTPLEAITR